MSDRTDRDAKGMNQQDRLDQRRQGIEEVPLDETGVEQASLPDELTGRASTTNEDLTTLFGSTAPDHMTDGFRGSGDDDIEHIGQSDGDLVPESENDGDDNGDRPLI